MEDCSFCYLISGLGKSKDFHGFSWWLVSSVLRGCVMALEWLKITVVWCFRVVVKRMTTLRDLGCWLLGFLGRG